MKIRKMTADFGRLQGETITLGEGLNVIAAPNESGKSTWCAFLKAMLYGVDSAQRARAGFLPDKTRYAAWDGGEMAGEMELTWQGKDITLRRAALAGAPMKSFSAVYTGTETPVPELTGATAGETLTGVSRTVFENSAFIGQSGLRVAQGPELEKRMTAMLASGEEDVSFLETEKRLSAWQRERRWRSSGAIPELEAQLEEKTAALAAIRASAREIETKTEEVHAQEARCRALREQVTESRKRARKEALHRAAEGRAALQRAEEASQRAAERAEALHETLCADAFGDAAPEEAARRAEETAAQVKQLKAASEKKPPLLPPLLALALAVLCAAAGALLRFVWQRPTPAYALLIAAAVLLLGGLAALLLRRKALQKAAEASQSLADTLLEFDVPDAESLGALAAAHAEKWENWQQAVSDGARAEEELENARRVHKTLEEEILASLDFAGGEGEAALLGRDLSAAEERQREARDALAAAKGRLGVLGDPMTLESEAGALREKIARLQEEYDAIDTALSLLREADLEMQTRFSPRLGARAAELFEQLTEGRYDRVTLDRALSAQARQTGDAVAHDANYLSAGASDQLYLALRLAICELAMPEGEKCPLVLDDALSNFDDARCAAALSLLRELAKERQILLLSCHSREADMLAVYPDVHVIRK